MRIIKFSGLLLAGFIAAFFFTPLVQFLAGPLVVQDHLQKADAIVVLGGGWADNNQLGTSSLERYHYGIKLFQQNFGKYIIFSGGNLQGGPSEALTMAEMAADEGFSKKTILVDQLSETTWQNTLFVRRILLDKNLASVILVTSPYHTLRAKAMFTDLGIKTTAAPVPDSEFANSTGLSQLRMAKLVILEYLKYGLYRLHLTR